MIRNYIFFFLWIFSMHNLMAQENDLDNIIKGVQNKYAPDRRVEVFQVDAQLKVDSLILRGETTSKEGYLELLSELKSSHTTIIDSVRLLPDAKLGEKTEGLIYNSVGTIRYAPRYGSELVTQTSMGTPVKILEERGGWRRIQTPDKYIGWINGSVKPVTTDEINSYLKEPKLVITSVNAVSYEKADENSIPVSDLTIGNILVFKGESSGFYEVVYPDGREAYVKLDDAKKVSDWFDNIKLTGESIVENAYRFKGIPYLWGGTSSKGLDCSGFTKTVYLMHGINLPRDASQQVHKGELVDETGDFSKLLPGDLLFFGTKANADNPNERVVHVGIYIGNNHFIHASDYVRVNSLDPSDTLYDKFNANRYLRTKRYIDNGHHVNVDIMNPELLY